MTKLFKKKMKNGKVYLLGDVHIGHVQANKQLFQKAIKWISSKASGDDVVIFMGDLFDSIYPTDRRFDARAFETVEESYTWFDSVVEPLSDIDTVILEGNHEEKVARLGNSPMNYILKGRPKWHDGSYGCVIDLGKCWGYVNHGHGGGRYHGAKVNNIEREAGYFDGAEFLFMGHVHWLFTSEVPKLGYNRGKRKFDHNRMLVGYTGCFLSTYNLGAGISSYGERALYSDVVNGFLVMNVENGHPAGVMQWQDTIL